MTAQETEKLMSSGISTGSSTSTNILPSSKTSSTNFLTSSKTSSTDFLTPSNSSSTHVLPSKSIQAESKAAARNHLQRAESKLRRKPLRWKPRLEVAGEEYCLAASHLLKGNMLEEAVDSLIKAGDCFQANRSWIRSAKVRERAIHLQLTKSLATETEVVKNARKISVLYIKANHPDAAAAVLQKTAETIFGKNQEESINLYKQAIDILEIEHRPTLAAMYSVQMMKLLVKTRGAEEEALEAALKTMHLYQLATNFAKVGSCLVILCLLLLRDKGGLDWSDILSEYSSNLNEENRELIEKLQNAVHEHDTNLLKEIKESKILKSFNQEIQDLANEVFQNLNDTIQTDNDKASKLSEASVPFLESSNKEDNENVDISSLVDGVTAVPVLAAAAVATAALAATSLAKKKPSLIKQIALQTQQTLPSGSFLPTSIPCPRLVADAVGFSMLGAAQYGMSTDQFREYRKDIDIHRQPSIEYEE